MELQHAPWKKSECLRMVLRLCFAELPAGVNPQQDVTMEGRLQFFIGKYSMGCLTEMIVCLYVKRVMRGFPVCCQAGAGKDSPSEIAKDPSP